ncbi:hypothetical protein MADE_000001022650 [Alteromonas mediterranea DE]|uniref:Uncharacterized protein n=1 Tax=Alteromonas mediterranea (strain DSM 17117 / CIP 110805 / LMG 28347 / Deep ecotype) TaxID=1774373 RepID=T2DL53_ALTMD|nr:hypothetical protein MADE_000001022650 [Alteromonas mediterranea DE]
MKESTILFKLTVFTSFACNHKPFAWCFDANLTYIQ